MNFHLKAFVALASLLPLCLACGDRTAGDSNGETMYQVATLQSLMSGNFDGFVSVGEFRKMGDIGLGTFEKADGEMILLDGTVYQARGDGKVSAAPDSAQVPFAVATRFDCDISLDINGVSCLQELSDRLTEVVEQHGRNLIYAVCIRNCKCDSVVFRSVLPQEKPYRPLAEALSDSQRVFGCKDMEGTVVAVYFPEFFNLQNAVGWHFHFLSQDCTTGGHLLEISSRGVLRAQLDVTPCFSLYLPDRDDFNQKDIGRDMSSEIDAIEK